MKPRHHHHHPLKKVEVLLHLRLKKKAEVLLHSKPIDL
jgi:hypothetical protein